MPILKPFHHRHKTIHMTAHMICSVSFCMDSPGWALNSSAAPLNTTTNPLVVNPINFFNVLTIVICVLVITFNGTVLILFLKDTALRKQPLSVYLMYLLFFNICYAAIQSPLEIINYRYSHWWIGEAWCVIFYYSTNVVACGAMFAHLLITLSRIWAVTFPLSFRRTQSTKMAVLPCVLLWIYVHAAVLPEMITKIQQMPTPLEKYGCRARYPKNRLVQILTYVVPLLVVVLAYPYIAYKRYSRTKKRRIAVAIQQLHARSPAVGPTARRSTASGARPNRIETMDHAFLVLTLLTASSVVCWTPVTIAFLLDRAEFTAVHFKISIFLFAFQPALDPILFTAALKHLRTALRRILLCSWS